MKDPGNPRRSPDGQDGEQPSPQPINLAENIGLLMRLAALFGVFAIFVVAAFYAVRVFVQLGSLIADPGNAREAVALIAELINEDRLAFSLSTGERISPGRVIAFLLLLLAYVLWISIPMKLIYTCGKILVEGLRAPKKPVKQELEEAGRGNRE